MARAILPIIHAQRLVRVHVHVRVYRLTMRWAMRRSTRPTGSSFAYAAACCRLATNRMLLPGHRPQLLLRSDHQCVASSCRPAAQKATNGWRRAVRKWRSPVPWLVAQVCSAGEDFDGEVLADRQSRNYACRFTAHEAGLHSVRTRLPMIRLLDKQERDRAVPTSSVLF